MLKKVIAILVVAGVGYSIYEYYTGPFYDAPPLKEGEFLLAYKNGFRGVMSGFDGRDQSRRYMSYDANNIPPWYKETWSRCRVPQEAETSGFESAVDMGPGGRLEAVCEIDADGDVFVRGWIVTVPNL